MGQFDEVIESIWSMYEEQLVKTNYYKDEFWNLFEQCLKEIECKINKQFQPDLKYLSTINIYDNGPTQIHYCHGDGRVIIRKYLEYSLFHQCNIVIIPEKDLRETVR